MHNQEQIASGCLAQGDPALLASAVSGVEDRARERIAEPIRETTEIRELTSDELDRATGGFGPFIALTFAGRFYDVAVDALITMFPVREKD